MEGLEGRRVSSGGLLERLKTCGAAGGGGVGGGGAPPVGVGLLASSKKAVTRWR